ncbi:Putative ribonuclease H protein At1g65750 [Linum perenne]
MLVGSRAAIRDGCDTLMWSGRWVDSGIQLGDYLRENVEIPNPEDKVVDIVNTDRQWDIERLSRILKPEAVEMVIGMSTTRPGRGEDLCVWGGELDGRFSIKSAYRLICDPNPHHLPIQDPWHSIWRWKGPNRVRACLWLTSHERLLTNLLRKRRNMTDDGLCGYCLHYEETVGHVLRDCSFAKIVWRQLGSFDMDGDTWNGDTSSWISHYLKAKQSLTFGVACWQIWKARNERLFTALNLPAASIAGRILHWSNWMESAHERDRNLDVASTTRRDCLLAWEPGPEGWWTLNSDGSVDPRREDS